MIQVGVHCSVQTMRILNSQLRNDLFAKVLHNIGPLVDVVGFRRNRILRAPMQHIVLKETCVCVWGGGGTPKSFKSCSNCEVQQLRPTTMRLNHEFRYSVYVCVCVRAEDSQGFTKIMDESSSSAAFSRDKPAASSECSSTAIEHDLHSTSF